MFRNFSIPRRPCCHLDTHFYCPYCPCPYLIYEVPQTSGGYSGNTSPNQCTFRRSSSDILLRNTDNAHAYENIDIENMTYERMNEFEESMRDVSRGLPEWKIARLPTHKFGKTPKFTWWWQKKKNFGVNDSECSICLVDYEKGDKVTTLPCNHIYHKDCISHWLKESKVCCVCKRELCY